MITANRRIIQNIEAHYNITIICFPTIRKKCCDANLLIDMKLKWRNCKVNLGKQAPSGICGHLRSWQHCLCCSRMIKIYEQKKYLSAKLDTNNGKEKTLIRLFSKRSEISDIPFCNGGLFSIKCSLISMNKNSNVVCHDMSFQMSITVCPWLPLVAHSNHLFSGW